MKYKPWTPDQEELLRKLVIEKQYSSSQCADEMKRSRNSIIGKARAMKLELYLHLDPNEKPSEKKMKYRELDVFMGDVINYKHILDAKENDCRWPYGEKSEYCCGKPKVIGSYCQKHAEIGYANVKPSKPNLYIVEGGVQ